MKEQEHTCCGKQHFCISYVFSYTSHLSCKKFLYTFMLNLWCYLPV